ncbi:MAG TPA: shikimate dehydrogenase [Streptosporangiaceae bacterium]
MGQGIGEEHQGRDLTADARRAAVLGSPISHSLSPALHRAAYRELGLTGWTYEAIECAEAGLPGLLAALGPDWAGLSLTMPLKRAVLPLLDSAEPLVGQVGGANTVVFGTDGSRRGHNTDVPGMAAALAAAGVTAVPDALVLGAGATACAALGALGQLGAREVTAAVRNPATAREFQAVAGRLGIAVTLAPFGAGPAERSAWPLLVSTVPSDSAAGYAKRIQSGTVVPDVAFDVVYHPWPTALAAAAKRAGAVCVSGFELLLHQAARQVELMTGLAAPLAEMRAAGLAELAAR